MKSRKFTTMRAVALGVAVMFIAASCGSSDSSSGAKSKNTTLCFDTQADKDAAIEASQAALDAATATDTTGASGGYRRPAVRSMSGTTIDPTDTTAPATDETTDTTTPMSDTTVPSSDTTVVDSGPNIPMLEQALADAQDQPLCETADASSESNAEPYINAVTDATATVTTDGSVVLNWTAPESSNIEVALIVLAFSEGWAVWTRAGNTSYQFDQFLASPRAGYFTLYAGSAGCIGEGTVACAYGPRTSVDVNVLGSNGGTTDSTDALTDTAVATESTDATTGTTASTATTATTVAPTDTTIASLTTDAPVDTTIATVTTAATGTTVQAVTELVFIETPLSAVELLAETPVLVATDVVSMICDEGCISAMFAAAELDSGTITINGVSASFGATSMRFPVDGKTGTIQAVVASSDGTSVLDVSTSFDHVEGISPAAVPASAEGATSTPGSSKSIYIYVLIALLVLVAIGYMRRKKATETK